MQATMGYHLHYAFAKTTPNLKGSEFDLSNSHHLLSKFGVFHKANDVSFLILSLWQTRTVNTLGSECRRSFDK